MTLPCEHTNPFVFVLDLGGVCITYSHHLPHPLTCVPLGVLATLRTTKLREEQLVSRRPVLPLTAAAVTGGKVPADKEENDYSKNRVISR